MREGRLDPAVAGWARGVLKDASLDGRDRPSVRAQVGALLDALRKQAVYAPDAYGAEVISSASATLCLRPGLCINGGDCDDLSVALGSALLSLGIPVVIVKQSFGSDNQEHVLIAAQGEDQQWIYADPSTRLPVGSAPNATDEEWFDPMGEIGAMREASPEIVTLGAPPKTPKMRHVKFVSGYWWEEVRGRVFVHDGIWKQTGLGAIPRTGVGAFVTPGDVLAYRKIWDDYVMGTARALATCSAAWAALAAGQTPATPPNLNEFTVQPDQKTLQLWATSNQQFADSLVASWNMHANKQDWEIVAMAGDILQDFQRVVQNAGGFYRNQVAGDCPSLQLPNPPGIDVQDQVIGQIEGLGILAHGTMQLFTMGANGALETYQKLGDKLTNPTTLQIGGVGIIIGVGVTLVGIVMLDRFLLPARR
jgi:hypothetical protein